MGRICEVCKKKPNFGNNVSHSHRKTRRKWGVNLVSIRGILKGSIKRIRICTRCLRSGKVLKAHRSSPEAIQ